MSDTKRCNATMMGKRCDFTGTRQELHQHADETTHTLCRICQHSLQNHEPTVCDECVQKVRDALTGIAKTDLEPAIEATALHPGTLPGGNALVMAADGSIESPQRPDQYTHPVESVATAHIERPEISGSETTIGYWRRVFCKTDDCTETRFPHQHTMTATTTHPAYVEERKTPDGREHVKDHWPSDPLLPLATLDGICRIWRTEFGHGPAEPIATIANTTTYLLTWLQLAAKTWEGFDADAREILALHSQMTHITGQANDPDVSPAPCFDCGGKLIRDYREPVPTIAPRKGHDFEGRPDDYTCRGCKRAYDPPSYWLAVRAFLEARAIA